MIHPPADAPVLANPSDPGLAVSWLVRARRGVLVFEVLLMIGAEAGTHLHWHSPSLIATLTILALVDVMQSLWSRTNKPTLRLVVAHVAFDLLALTALLVESGGAWNPLVSAYLVYLALLATVLPGRFVWGAAGGAMALQALVVWWSGSQPGVQDHAMLHGDLVGHVIAFDLAAIAITWVVRHLSLTLRVREARELQAQHERDVTERLAALGTLAAGVAHELGTPIGTIQLLAEEAATEPFDEEQRALLLLQVERCRALLDRLRHRNAEELARATCRPDVGAWVAEWGRAVPEVAVEVQALSSEAIAGAAESWRGAVWVALDNARRAGARRVTVAAHDRGDALELQIQDDGRGLPQAAAERASEPFRSGWGGTGLGLFVARSFAQSVGGDVVLEPLADGALARIIMPKVAT
ncbi:MAG: HAMP domain-containing histidine kinase [Alphaproteobacteria bacterium]|nr:HAMP domain-containing histidine kinase [Alphaproteobacteria bacterium]